MSFEFILRIVGMIVLSIIGGYWGYDIARSIPNEVAGYTMGFALLGALSGLLFTPYITTRATVNSGNDAVGASHIKSGALRLNVQREGHITYRGRPSGLDAH